ncbi:MAG: hypothetical protein QM796_10850 [Chthoniobacteraceae bacterium]
MTPDGLLGFAAKADATRLGRLVQDLISQAEQEEETLNRLLLAVAKEDLDEVKRLAQHLSASRPLTQPKTRQL